MKQSSSALNTNPTPLSELSRDCSTDMDCDIIFIRDFTGETIIGICDDELETRQKIIINISIGIARSLACTTDRIEHTVDYDKVRKLIKDLLKTHRYKLLEGLGEEIANQIFTHFNAKFIRIEIKKPHKYPDVDSVGVSIFRKKATACAKSPTVRKTNILDFIGEGHITS